jgi:signal peptidase I
MPKKRTVVKILVPIAVVMVLAFLYSILFLSFARVPTAAMKNTILVGDCVVANRITGRIERGDIILFKYPMDTRTTYIKRVIGLPGETIQFNPETHLVLINGEPLPEHKIKAGQQAADDPGQLDPTTDEGGLPGAKYTVYYQRDTDTGSDAMFGVGPPYRIPKKGDAIPDEMKSSDYRNTYDADHDGRYDTDQYFCMGDNRDNSEDSRYYGTIPANLIVARALAIYWSQEPEETGGRIRWNRIFKKLK